MVEKATDFLKRLLQIKSINPPGNELAVALEIKTFLEASGIKSEIIEFAPGRANLIATLYSDGHSSGQRTLGISGHMDVVPPGQEQWASDPFLPVERDGKIFARGASDMKSGLVALIIAMALLRQERVRLRGNVKLLATAGEEAGSTGAKELAKRGYVDDLDALLIGEPTYGELVFTHKGALWIEITCHGKTAHGARPHLGTNAIVHMTKLLQTLSSDKFKMRYDPDPVLGNPTLSIGTINGGVKVNVVPDRCTAEIDIRTLPSQNHQEILSQIEATIASLKFDIPDFRCDVRVTNEISSLKTSPEHPFVNLVKDSVTRTIGVEPHLTGMSGYTDGATFVAAKPGLPTVILGPGDPRLAHQPDEYVEIDRFLSFIDIYKTIFVNYLGA